MAMIRLDLKSVRYDRLAGVVQFNVMRQPDLVIEVSKEALEDHFQKTLSPDDAILRAVDLQTFIEGAALKNPIDDGKIRLTTTTLNGREWT